MSNNGLHISEWIASLDIHKPFYLAIIDKDGLFSFTNTRFFTEFLSSHSQLTGISFLDFVPQSDHVAFKDTLAAATLQEDAVTTQIRINNGLCRWVKWEINSIGGYGQPPKWLCMGYDIADEVQIKRTEEILGLNYQTIVEDMTVGILLQDAEGKVITANRKAAELFNTTLEELYTTKSLPFASGAAEDTPFSTTLRTRKAQTNVVIYIPLVRGKNRVLLCNWQPLFEHSESVPYSILSTFQDISKEKQFEKEAQARTALFSAFMDNAPFFSWIVDNSGRLVFANKGLLDHLQVGESVFGKPLSAIMPGSIAEMILERLELPPNFTRDQRTVKCRLADGAEHIFRIIVFPVEGGVSGTLVGGEALDVTEAYRAREEEKRVSERLRDLETQLADHRLAEQKSTAEAIIRAQEDERTRIGHELHDNINQILASSKLYVSHLKRACGDFKHVKERALELLELAIDEVRTLSKTMVLPDLKKGGLVASIDDLVDDLRFSNQFEVVFNHCETVGLEDMDQSKKVTMFRIVQEQTKNILKYSHARKVEIALHLQNNWIRLEIKDDGVGFDPERIKRGLGLSNIYERARLYDGKVRLSAAPGEGCSIVVTIPLIKGA